MDSHAGWNAGRTHDDDNNNNNHNQKNYQKLKLDSIRFDSTTKRMKKSIDKKIKGRIVGDGFSFVGC